MSKTDGFAVWVQLDRGRGWPMAHIPRWGRRSGGGGRKLAKSDINTVAGRGERTWRLGSRDVVGHFLVDGGLCRGGGSR